VTNSRVFFYTRGRGCNGHPAFPAPFLGVHCALDREGRDVRAKLGRIARRGRGVVFDEHERAPLSVVIISESGRSSTLQPCGSIAAALEYWFARSSRAMTSRPPRPAQMTIFWHCGLPPFSSKTGPETRFRQPTVNGFGRGCRSTGSGDADWRRMVRSSGGRGFGRRSLRDSGCVRAHPADWRASASYRPLRAVWAFAPGHSGVARDHQNPSALEKAAHDHKEFSQ
jgi:hypothetical protein